MLNDKQMEKPISEQIVEKQKSADEERKGSLAEFESRGKLDQFLHPGVKTEIKNLYAKKNEQVSQEYQENEDVIYAEALQESRERYLAKKVELQSDLYAFFHPGRILTRTQEETDEIKKSFRENHGVDIENPDEIITGRQAYIAIEYGVLTVPESKQNWTQYQQDRIHFVMAFPIKNFEIDSKELVASRLESTINQQITQIDEKIVEIDKELDQFKGQLEFKINEK